MFGFRRKKGMDSVYDWPVEYDDADKKIIDHVLRNKLSMASRQGLFATLGACRHAARNEIAGDFVECGVWRGGNAIIAADVFHRLAKPGSIYLYDTFAGMTEPTVHDVIATTGEHAGARYDRRKKDDHNTWCYSPLEEVEANFRDAGLMKCEPRMIKGDVLDTLKVEENLPKAISVLRLDTDWYESTKCELEVLWPRLSSGGILIVDDYGHFTGARKAVDEFFSTRPYPFLHHVDYSSRLVVKP